MVIYGECEISSMSRPTCKASSWISFLCVFFHMHAHSCTILLEEMRLLLRFSSFCTSSFVRDGNSVAHRLAAKSSYSFFSFYLFRSWTSLAPYSCVNTNFQSEVDHGCVVWYFPLYGRSCLHPFPFVTQFLWIAVSFRLKKKKTK